MTEALAVAPKKEVATIDKNIYETLALRGDISLLNPQDKAIYLQKLCESLGMNPYTQPFIPLKLNGKEVLYATKGAADQLASINKLTREVINRDRLEDVYIVTCKVTSADGRFDISTGAVTIGNLKGDSLANALMKAETKAKRRATLSFCGLGFLDESELETIPANRMQMISSAPDQLPPPPSTGSVLKDHHLKKERENPISQPQVIEAEVIETVDVETSLKWREEIEKLYNAAQIHDDRLQAGLKYFDEHPADRALCINKARKTFIKEMIMSEAWTMDGAPMNEEQTATYLERFGIKAIDTASPEQIEKFSLHVFNNFVIPF